MIKEKIIIDAGNSPLGRVASYAAKNALIGKAITIVNCDNAVVSGRKSSVIGDYKEARTRGGSSLNGPHFPREPFRIMKRTVRGMLSYKQGRGHDALKKVICYNNIPEEFKQAEKISLTKDLRIKPITLKELSNIL
ncbi:MAG: 50S ribosomal protein L13 [Nanoarchaeota archaeon]